MTRNKRLHFLPLRLQIMLQLKINSKSRSTLRNDRKPGQPRTSLTLATVNAISALEGRYAQIQSEEAILQQRIHEMERWHLGRLERADLENLRRQLADLRHEEREVKSQLNQLQKAQP